MLRALDRRVRYEIGGEGARVLGEESRESPAAAGDGAGAGANDREEGARNDLGLGPGPVGLHEWVRSESGRQAG